VPAALGSDIGGYYDRHPVEAQAFSQAMNGMSGLALQAIDAVWDLPAATCVVDVGGAHGSFLTHVLHRRPAARGVLFDLPHVIATAGPALAAAGVAGRVEPVAGDFMRAVPAGGDVYLLKHVLHEWNDAQARTILRNVRQAMTPAATVVTVEMLIPEDGAPSPALLMDLDMLVTSSGRERTAGEMKALFAAAGLAITRVLPTASPFFVLEAQAG
jgi:hypothetical protein